MKSMILLAPILTLAACASTMNLTSQRDLQELPPRPEGSDVTADSHKHVYDKGRILVVETDDAAPNSGGAIDHATVITATAEKKEQFAILLKASAVKPGILMDWPIFDDGQVETLEEYMHSLENGFKISKEAYEKLHPGQKFPFSDQNYASLQAEMTEQLKNHDAIIHRSVHIKRSNQKY